MGAVDAGPVRTMVRRLETLRDISWCLNSELLENIAKGLGGRLDSPFAALSFLALPVIPELRLTDLGLVDVNEFKLVE